MRKVTDGVVDVIVYPSATDKSKNRGFAFIEYESHKAAAMARRKLIPGTFQLWGHTIQVDWAEPEKDVDEATMQRVRVLYVRNLMLTTSEETLRQQFSCFKPGAVERVKKLTDYAFVHYHFRDDALMALHLMNGTLIDGAAVEVTLAKPVNKESGRRFSNRGYIGSGNTMGPYSDAPSSKSFHFQGCEDVETMRGAGVMDVGTPLRPASLPSRLGGLSLGTGNMDRFIYPYLPGTNLLPVSLLSLKPGQLSSAVTLLEYYCYKNSWTLPEYHLYSTPGQEGRLLLIYKVVILSTRSSFMPDKVCTVLEDAKELAAQNTLWSLDCSFVNGNSPGSVSPPPAFSNSTGLLSYGCTRAVSYSPYPLSPSLPHPTTPQRLYPLPEPCLLLIASPFYDLRASPRLYPSLIG
ncbi:hypothetical protein UPYG_G00245540 [Umbra pygmaea]|uniref:RRM domain-containing protein n=1 Tax=Umbra pygmaea TaxID=75934 RepID=A0ABD0WL09_UMBPY